MKFQIRKAEVGSCMRCFYDLQLFVVERRDIQHEACAKCLGQIIEEEFARAEGQRELTEEDFVEGIE